MNIPDLTLDICRGAHMYSGYSNSAKRAIIRHAFLKFALNMKSNRHQFKNNSNEVAKIWLEHKLIFTFLIISMHIVCSKFVRGSLYV